MKKSFVISFLCMFLATQFLYGRDFSEAEQKKIREYPQSVVNRIEKHEAENLINDDYFLQVLTDELKNKNYKTEDKVYFFYLMMREIGWAFYGGITIPFPYTYPDFSLTQSAILYDYYKVLSSLRIDSGPFFNIAFRNANKKPILASYAFLLGALLEPDASIIYEFCAKAHKNGFFEKPTVFRTMLIHNMMLVSPVIVFGCEEDSSDEYSNFLRLLQAIFDECDCKEEEKEDLVISAIYDDNYGSFITQRLIDEKDNSNNYFVLTSAILIKERLNSIELFMNYVSLWESYETENWKKNIITNIKNNDYMIVYHYIPSGHNFSKTWDGVSLILYDNGVQFKYDGHSEFLPIKTIKR